MNSITPRPEHLCAIALAPKTRLLRTVIAYPDNSRAKSPDAGFVSPLGTAKQYEKQ